MSSSDNAHTKDSLPVQSNLVIAVADDLTNLDIQDDDPSLISQDDPDSRQNHTETPPFIMYSRSQLLLLHKSPLVHLPSGMPALKDWFGTENDQLNTKKDSETTVPVGSSRDRRFRRDAEDSASARQSFRGAAITQPSQMGNFKHQSIRAADRDRDRDRDTDKDQDRDKVKEGQERLRNLSDKYDRDRRALSSISHLRTKERELAPHLANAASRVASQGQQPTAPRTGDSRDLQRKKEGESDEDWRRGPDQHRTGRERLENSGRRDRDDRERPRSRVRDSSRPRREGSSSRRDDRRVDRDDGHGGYRRDRDDRDRDIDRDSELEDPRRWRDDGKRDERIAARRERETRERERELRDRRDRPAWDGGERSDRRWVAGEDRDGRGKRLGGRDRKVGDETKDRDDRKDREKEPAWMDTYIPSSGGVTGGQRHDGELDGIQAFRKEMQQKEKSTSPAIAGLAAESHTQASSSTLTPESQLDEIQLFRLMMKREEEKKKSESLAISQSDSSGNLDPDDAASEERAPQVVIESIDLGSSEDNAFHISSLQEHSETFVSGTPNTDVPAPVASSSSPQPVVSATSTGQEPCSLDKPRPSSSRLLSTTVGKASVDATVAISTNVPQSHPPATSRLLALGSRTPQNPNAVSIRPASSQSPVSFVQKNGSAGYNAVAISGTNLNSSVEIPPHPMPAVENLRVNNGFSPFEEHREPPTQPNLSDPTHRGPLTMANDRVIFAADHALTPEPGFGGSFSNNPATQSFDPVGSGAAAAKGSRFAKFFDAKSRDNQPTTFGKGTMGGPGLSQLGLPQKMDAPGLNAPHNPDARAMEDIFAMLNNSAQAQRLNVVPELSNMDVGYGTPSNNLHGLSIPQVPPHSVGHNRLDSIYDDRNFVPDGLVPGLRSVPPPRSRQGSTMFSDFPEEPIQFNNNQRAPTQVYQGPVPSLHLQHGNMGRGGPISMQASQFRGGPSPNHHPAPVQRLPPGLANLGGRPPHDPSHFVNTSVGIANGGMHGTVHGNAPPFNNFQQPALNFPGGPQMRAPHPGTHQLSGALGPNALQGLVHPGNLGSNQAQLMGLAGANGIQGGLRGPGGFGHQGHQVQPHHITMRQPQQPQQQIPPHMLPLHLQQGFGGNATSQPAHDLMALLMNGARRD